MTSLVSVAASGCARRLSMFGRALDTLRRLLAKPEPSAIALARRARLREWLAYADAKRRKDTRDIHVTYWRYRRATDDVVRLELAARR